jgi:NAD(P)-dependent dehydrogenase (short-subunit alcohol dehydrogenase family)
LQTIACAIGDRAQVAHLSPHTERISSGSARRTYEERTMANKSAKTGKSESDKTARPPQKQARQPGRQTEMTPAPQTQRPEYQGSGKLKGKCALITGGDSGIGRAVAVHFAKEGADVAIVYLEEDTDAKETQRLVEAEGRKCVPIRGDISKESFCQKAVTQTIKQLGDLHILVNNAAQQYPQESIADISEKQLERTFRVNIFAMFFFVKAALERLEKNRGVIINTTSVTAYRGSPKLVDYAATKGAIVAFTRSLSGQLAEKHIRVNAVAPGPIWTPLIPATFPPDKVAKFGEDVPLGHAGEPAEVAPAFVFLASNDASYFTGQVLHPNGGEIING